MDLHDDEVDDFVDGDETETDSKKALILNPIRDLDVHPPVIVSPATSAAEAVRLMGERGIGCVLVKQDRDLLGILTERDLLMKVTLKDRRASEFTVADLMTADPQTLHPENRIAVALNLMSVGGYRHIPLVDDDGRLVGVISMNDVVTYLVENFPHEVLTLPPVRGKGFASPDGG